MDSPKNTSTSIKAIVIAPSAGGKSSLMRYMRSQGQRNAPEADDEILKANDDEWPDSNNYKDKILLPKIMDDIISQDSVIFLASYVPEPSIKAVVDHGFKIILIDVDAK